MRTLIRGLGLAVLLPAIASAQQVRGVVVEDSTFRPIADVTVELRSLDGTVRATSVSAGSGWFELFAPGTGQFVIHAHHQAYTRTDTLALGFAGAEILTVVLRLSGGPIPLEPLTVRITAQDRLSGYRERARKGAFGRYITRADIDKYGGYSLSHVLRFTPEVRIERVSDGPFTVEGVFMRSFGDLCVPSVYLDGVPVPTGRVFDINALLSSDEVEGVEVYRSYLSAPMEFRLPAFDADMSCGVIVVWSRRPSLEPMSWKRMFFAESLVGASLLLLELLR